MKQHLDIQKYKQNRIRKWRGLIIGVLLFQLVSVLVVYLFEKTGMDNKIDSGFMVLNKTYRTAFITAIVSFIVIGVSLIQIKKINRQKY